MLKKGAGSLPTGYLPTILPCPKNDTVLAALPSFGTNFEVSVLRTGNVWCALLGQDLQTGVAGFGESPTLALRRLCTNLESASQEAVLAIYANARGFYETQTEMHPEHRKLFKWFADACSAAFGQRTVGAGEGN
jgi:hypothetical protein